MHERAPFDTINPQSSVFNCLKCGTEMNKYLFFLHLFSQIVFRLPTTLTQTQCQQPAHNINSNGVFSNRLMSHRINWQLNDSVEHFYLHIPIAYSLFCACSVMFSGLKQKSRAHISRGEFKAIRLEWKRGQSKFRFCKFAFSFEIEPKRDDEHNRQLVSYNFIYKFNCS